MKKSLLILLAIIFAITIPTHAEDFWAVYNGDTIYYNITSSTSPLTVAVTYKGDSLSSNSNDYYGFVSIPDSVQYNDVYYNVSSISNNAFKNCSGLTSITIPNSVISIGGYAFSNCTNLSSIQMPDFITSISGNTFENCSSLESINIPSSVTTIYFRVFHNCTSLKSITIPHSVSRIGSYAFQGCTSLDTVIFNAKNCITTESQYNPIFQGCNNLSTIIIGDSVINIQNYAFSECTTASLLSLPNSIISIGDFAFNNCIGLTSIKNNSIIPPIITVNSFYGVNKNTPILVPCTSIATYQAADNWDEFTNFKPFAPIDIEAQILSNYIELTWKEDGCSYIVYRNNDSITTTTIPIYLDYDIIQEQSYCYKVKATNGILESELSDEACLIFIALNNIQMNNITTKLYPNPSNGKAKLEVEGLGAEADVLVYDMVGRVIQRHSLSKGNKVLDIDLSGYAKGVYSIRIMNDGVNQTLKLVVQ